MDDETLDCGGAIARHVDAGDTVRVCVVRNRVYDHTYDTAAIERQEFHHPIYLQLYPDFQLQMSAVEALFLMGPEGGQLLNAGWPEKLEQVFS
jgi:hypothetical protein